MIGTQCYKKFFSLRGISKPILKRNASISLSHIESPSAEALSDICGSLQLHPDFISELEETNLYQEIMPKFKRIRYQQDHWDSAIVGYRETEVQNWSALNAVTIDRVLTKAELKSNDRHLAHVHVLDLDANGFIKPHVDSVRFCGDKIAGVSLLTDAIMRFVHTKDSKKYCDVLLSRRSLYIMNGASRYDYTHEILPSNTHFKGLPILKSRRIAVICRSQPKVPE